MAGLAERPAHMGEYDEGMRALLQHVWAAAAYLAWLLESGRTHAAA